MGRQALTVVLALVLGVAMRGAAVAEARPRSASVAVASSCGSVVEAADVVVAMRVELAALGIVKVTADGGGDVTVAVDCAASGAILVASREQRAELPLADVAPEGRARVVALVVADWLRPSRAPAVADKAARRELGPLVRGVGTSDDRVGTAGVGIALRRGAVRGELEAALVIGTNHGDPFQGGLLDLRVAYEPLQLGTRTRIGGAFGVLGARTNSGTSGDGALALHGGPRVRFALGGGAWSALVTGGLGHGIDKETGWFGLVDVAAMRGF